MRLPSMRVLASEAGRVGRRFPFVLTSACAAAVCATVAVGNPDSSWWVRVLMGAELGIPFLLALALAGERHLRLRWPLGLIGTALILLYTLTLPARLSDATLARFFQFNVAAHLLVACLAYAGRDEPNGFWQFNKGLFLHLLRSLVFTGVLVVGIDVAILALDQLFGLQIDDKLYVRVDLVLLFVFNTWYFLGGVPRDFARLEAAHDYPRGLMVFAQYILAPLVALYLALLLAYLVKVVATTDWPSGWIGWLVSCVAAAGLFSLVLLHPRIGERGQRWISTYARAYFVLMLPSIGMLFMALGKRIGQYGFTENRYFMCVLALWLLGVALAGAFDRLKRLEALPATLALIALFTSFGPWGAYAVARGSQLGRFEQLLESEGMLENGRIEAAGQVVDLEARREMSAILDYLMDVHGPRSIQDWLTEEQKAELARLYASDEERRPHRALSKQVMRYLGTTYATDWARNPDRTHYFVQRRHDSAAIEVPARSYVASLRIPSKVPPVFTMAGQRIEAVQDGNDISLLENGRSLLTLGLESMLLALESHVRTVGEAEVPDRLMTVTSSGDSLRVRLLVDSAGWRRDEGRPRLERLTGYLLLEPLVPSP